MSTSRSDIAFLFDVDNTLLDNDRVIDDLQSHLEQEIGAARIRCYWALFEQLRTELGYADYTVAPKILADYPAAHISLDSVGDLRQYELAELLNHEHLK
jgi:FMN phosphatase YigB (HAD superfamily)